MITPGGNSSCRQNYSYFASAEFLRNSYHFSAILDLPVAVLVFYCILKVTPRQMSSMKWVLLHMHVCITHLDIFLTLLAAPYIFFPNVAGLPLGLLGYLGVNVKLQCYWGHCAGSFLAISTVMLYENRQNQIDTIKHKMTKTSTKLIYYGLNYTMALTMTLPFFKDDSDQAEMREYALKNIPCPTVEFDDPRTFVLLKGNELLPYYLMNLLVFTIGSQILFYAFRTVYHLVFVTSFQVSESTRKLQQKYFIYVSIQVFIPMVVVVLPLIYIMFCGSLENSYNQTYNNFAFSILANYGFFSALSTVLIYKPYRDFCRKKMFFRRCTRASPPSTEVTEMTINLET